MPRNHRDINAVFAIQKSLRIVCTFFFSSDVPYSYDCQI